MPIMSNLQPGQRLRAYRQANELVDASVTDPAIRAAVLTAAVMLAKAEGAKTAATRFAITMSPRPHEALGGWRERLAKAHGVDVSEVSW